MSDTEQSAPPAKKPRLETAEEARNAACKKHSQLQAELLQEMRKDSSSDLVAALEEAVKEASKDVDRARQTLQFEREQAKQSEARVVKQGC